MPDPEACERELMTDAARGWITWANLFGNFDDGDHPARRALSALRAREAQARAGRP